MQSTSNEETERIIMHALGLANAAQSSFAQLQLNYNNEEIKRIAQYMVSIADNLLAQSIS